MPDIRPALRTATVAFSVVALGFFAACKGKEPAPPAQTGSEKAGQLLQATSDTWTPEALEELLAPVALYPDPVLAQVLVASTNPQEVLDAGNWLIANPNLEGRALDEAAEKAGFTEPVRTLIQSPEVIDTMCLNLSWTEDLGQAYVNDQAGVMDAVQRLRAQAKEVGTLQSSEQLKVETQEQGGQQVITVSPPSPQVVYVPQYDPVTAYSPAATTTAQKQDEGHSTGSLVATGLLAFGAGLMVGEIFDDDDYYHGYHSTMWYRPPPYYPPYPYRPVYGGGFYPSYGYNRPPTYVRNNNVVVVNQNNNYWNRYGSTSIDRNRNSPRSPITTARPNRSELGNLNAEAKKGPKRTAPPGGDAWKGKGASAGADPKARDVKRGKAAAGRPTKGAAPKVQGTYAGARPTGQSARSAADKRPAASPSSPARTASKPAVAPSKPARPAAKPATQVAAKGQAASRAASSDRGYATPAAGRQPQSAGTRPQLASRPEPAATKTAMSGSNRGASDRAASTRGRASAPKGAPTKAKSTAGARRGR